MRLLAVIVGILAGAGLGIGVAHAETTHRSTAPAPSLATALDRLLTVEKTVLHHRPPAGLQPPPPERAAQPTRQKPGGDAVVRNLATLPAATGGAQWRCLTQAVYHEARGESIEGQLAIAEVVLNRVAIPSFPDNVCDVVRQRSSRRAGCQFSFVCDGQPDQIGEPAAWERAGKIARLALDGQAPRQLTLGATHFHTSKVHPRWARIFPQTTRIGIHLFYRDPTAPMTAAAPAPPTLSEPPANERLASMGNRR